MSNEQLAISNESQTRQMKDSGVEWIGEIPAHWEILRNKNASSYTKSIVGNESSKTQLLSLTTKGIREKDISDTAGKVPESYDTYQYVEVNDMVMCLFDLDCSAVFSGISSYNGMISPAYKVLKSKEKIVPKFADYWFKYVSDDRKFKQYSKPDFSKFSREITHVSFLSLFCYI